MNGRRRLLAASIISIQNANFVYPSCQNCLSRLLLDSKRYSCLRCGHSGDAKDTNYRYRLSLEVTDAHDVFEVTVFGSCLDAYFGVTAKGLQRYIEELNQEAGEPDRAASSGVVAEAVETCFIGKKFVFGVKDSIKCNDASSLQNDCKADRHPRALTACQMFVPNPQLVGCTVIQYLQQHQSAHLRHSPGGLGPPGGHFIPLDQPRLEHSFLQGSGCLGAISSDCIDGLSSLWPQSFGLTSSSTSGGTPEDPVAPSPSRTACKKQKEEAGLVSSHSLSSQSCQNHDLAGFNQSVQQDKKLHSFSTWCENFSARSESESRSALRRKGCRSLESLLELEEKLEEKILQAEPISRHSCGPEKSWNSLPFQKQGNSFGPLIVSSSIGAVRNSQEAPSFGDEMPSSESLSEFIAKLECNKAAELPLEAKAWECCPSQRPNEFHGHPHQSSPKPDIFHGTFLTGQPDEKLQKLAEKIEVWKEDSLPCRLNLSLLSGNESQQEAFPSSLPLTRKEGWRCLPNEHSVPFPWSSPAGIHPHSKGSCWSSTEGADQDVSSSKDLQACSSLKSISDCLEIPCLQIKKTVLLNCKHDTSLGIQRQIRSTSVSHEKSSEIHERGRKPLPEVQGHDSRGRNTSSLLQGDSDCPQGSYDASVDLFDSSARGVGVAIGTLDAVQAFSEPEGVLTEKHLTPELLPSELDASWDISLPSPSDPKTSTPVASSGAESEVSLAGTSDFVPYSQTTPFAKPCQQVRLCRGSESILSELPLNKLSWINARCRRSRPALQKPLRRQRLSKFLASRRVSNTCRTPGDVEDQMPLFTKGSPAQQLFENDSEEWIPPSERKGVQQLTSQNQKVFGLRRRRILLRNCAGDQIVAKSPLSENGPGCETMFTPTKPPPIEAPLGTSPIREDTASLSHQTGAPPGFWLLVDVDRLSPDSASHSVPNTASWSPELFVDDSPPPNTEPL
ncbi:DNA damage-induced apoptosis suppressor protein [Tiliqua scincoides]|uniref:DNA damage-induced apoptosis suppressor protein n=1 Tax=Tiliqua scincoides TaxID=71010 RepID=UPI00346364B2